MKIEKEETKQNINLLTPAERVRKTALNTSLRFGITD